MNKFGAVLYVKDVAKLTAFYADVTALPVTESQPTWARLGTEVFELVVHGIPPHIAEIFEISTPPERREEAAIKPIFPVSSITDARAKVAKLGGELNPPEREWTLDGLQICDGHDPEGNVFQLRAPVG